MRDPAVVFELAAQQRCLQIADEIVDEIWHSPLTPGPPGVSATGYVRTGTLKTGYDAVRDPASGGARIVNEYAPYWMYVEFGTRNMARQPHLRPAIEAVRARHT